MRITVSFGIKNVGKSPAINSFFEAKLAFPGKTVAIETIEMMTDYAEVVRKQRIGKLSSGPHFVSKSDFSSCNGDALHKG